MLQGMLFLIHFICCLSGIEKYGKAKQQKQSPLELDKFKKF